MKKFLLVLVIIAFPLITWCQTLYVPNGTSGIANNTSNGNVGIGTVPSLSFKLDVAGMVNSNALVVNQASSGNAQIFFKNQGALDWDLGTQVGDATQNFNLYNRGNSTIALSVNKSTGSVTINKDLIVRSVYTSAAIQSTANYGLVLVPTSGDAIINRSTSGNLVLSSGGGTSDIRLNFSYGGGTGGVSIFDGGATKYANLSITSAGNLNINTFGGKVGIGTNPSSIDSKLTVAGDIHSSEVKVSVGAGADFVFDENYTLKTLPEIEQYVKTNKHLPELASAKEMETNGIELGKMEIKLLQKIEELTLYMIDFKKEMDKVKEENQKLRQEITDIKRD